MKINNKVTYSAAGIGVVAAGAVLAGGMISPSNAAPNQGSEQAVATRTAPKTVQSARALQIKQLKRKYGMYPLPVSVKSAQKYNLKKRHMKDIKKSSRWAKTRKARSVVRCESGGNYRISTGNGYYGAWQFDRGTWRSNGGGKFGSTANKAPKWAQDYVAWKTWRARGWQPWACA